MKIIIQNSSDVPIYQQIYEQIREAILSKAISEGELLPSIRQLSRELKVSVITTTRAYTELEKDGYIMIVQGKGCYVKSINQHVLEERLLKGIEEHFSEILKSAKLLKKSDEELLQLLKFLMEEINYDK
ncbi:GntR family transcriptional regulator [Amphibacillus cookii]|uniref:GntR family transcriptional regulator n=1 Tax=Amphibacillus cookii TaxID=767787 RepID=UPI001959B10C|nr:GntR family transcriptional regulator [Amphibacillus cookii]MBM7542273.1 GntR family transcriptional regulator [Amphibacillus cookii]